MTWQVSLDPSRLQLDVVHGWLRELSWQAGIRRDVVERAFANSLVAGAYDDAGAQLGVARVVTDYAMFGWLDDVYVAPEARGAGIARAMVLALMADPRVRSLRRWLLATRDAHGVYATIGWEAAPSGLFMQRMGEPSAWSDRPR